MYDSGLTHAHNTHHAYMEQGATLRSCVGFLCLNFHICCLRNEQRQVHYPKTYFANCKQKVGVCRKPTDPPNLTQPDLTRRIGSVFKAWWVGLGYKNFFYGGSGWVWVIKLQTRQIQPEPPIFNIYLKYILYLIIFFKSIVGHLYRYIY